MKMVIDANYLQTRELREYLDRDPGHCVVITDDASKETLRGNALINISRSLAVVSDYPAQVLILKATDEIKKIGPVSGNLRDRFIDEEKTNHFKVFCHRIREARAGHAEWADEISRSGERATREWETLKLQHPRIVRGIRSLLSSIDPAHLKALRTFQPLPPPFIGKAVQDILALTAASFRENPEEVRMPSPGELRNHYLFRYAVCYYLLSIKWIANGGLDHFPPEKMANDIIDLSYATYATYFDGLLSKDKKMNALYRETRWFLDHVLAA